METPVTVTKIGALVAQYAKENSEEQKRMELGDLLRVEEIYCEICKMM